MNKKNIAELVNSKIRVIPNFPKAGISFKDITTAIKDVSTLALIIDWFVEELKDKQIDYVIGLESRGFIFASAIAYKLKAGFIPIRKPGKLPSEVETANYELEYGSDSIEIHKDAIEQGKNVAIVDDLLATGGTASAAAQLVNKLGGNIKAIAFLMELDFLQGRKKLPQNTEIMSLIVV